MTVDGRAPVPDVEPGAAVSRVRLDIRYDGAGFAGWAAQRGQRTVAGEVGLALSRLFPGATGLTVAGRTDTGVHATGQVAHVDVPVEEWERHADRVLWRLRGILPPDIRVTAATVVTSRFSARFSALWRRYEYRVSDTEWGVSPLRRHDTLAWTRPLDMAAMNRAATVLLGERDFAAFCKRREGATTIRALHRLTWSRGEDGILVATVVADAFCHSMVRSLVGAMLAVGDGRRDVEWLAGLLRRTDRSGEVVVAPAHGLTLAEVAYPRDPAEWGTRSDETRRMRTLPDAVPDSGGSGAAV
ncbi:tRNA pseudouridine38-40 synthase [Stackebrandtia albiflava]|uniref:tRNA pseudouridine synthase A n=1 Tax=Stackebrandtia albiflava TaxID=406432 RepID=A0A562V3C9_9ACTN|nr:tRNA pseudouridine(38-40) synthase TruA [Stackebrandtia albiflava]TWJ12400.1 tRNA pseudouridine38-40 synthase [Stackebrandtia albiflava]